MDATDEKARWAPELKGRTAIVTGAGRYRSIGRHVALELARQGVNLVLTGTGRDPALYPAEEKEIGWRDIDSVVAEAEALGVAALARISDAGDPAAVQALIDEAVARFGGADILINNAGSAVGADRVPVVDLPLEEWDRVVQTNLRGAFLTAQAAARAMIARGQGGVIINISSVASRLAAPNTGVYSVSKAGLNALSRTMASELASHAIRVNSVLPGIIATSRMSKAMERDDWGDLVRSASPLGYAGDGTEIAEMCVFLCSDRGKWITGQDLAVDGGYSWH